MKITIEATPEEILDLRLADIFKTENVVLKIEDLCQKAVGENGFVNSNITSENFKATKATGTKFKIEKIKDGETCEQAAKRLEKSGLKLANIIDLANYMKENSGEIEQYWWVVSLSEDSRWAYSGGFVCVPYARVGGALRRFDLCVFRGRLDFDYGVLVACE